MDTPLYVPARHFTARTFAVVLVLFAICMALVVLFEGVAHDDWGGLIVLPVLAYVSFLARFRLRAKRVYGSAEGILLAWWTAASRTVFATRKLWATGEGLMVAERPGQPQLYAWSAVEALRAPAWAFLWPLTSIGRIRLADSRSVVLYFQAKDAPLVLQREGS